MKEISQLHRGLFVCSIGFVIVGLLFTILQIPAAGLFSILGGTVALIYYVLFTIASQCKKHSDWARHVTVFSFLIGQGLKSMEVGAGVFLFLVALLCFLVWVTWSVLEALPPSED